MAIVIITRSISTKVWDQVAIEFAIPGVRHVYEVRQVTDCATRPIRYLDWLQSLKRFFINVPYHILVASLTLMALFYNRAIRVRLATRI